METWPLDSVLPRPDINLAASTDPVTLRLDMDSGRSRQRRRYTEDRLVINAQWSFSQQEFQLFRAFLKFKLNDGTDNFNMSIQFGGGIRNQVMRFVDGRYTSNVGDGGFWTVTAQLESIFNAGFCTPNVTSFLTIPLGDVDLSAYFGVVLASPLAATQWRLHTDDCGFNITYYTGTVNSDGTLNPGNNNPGGDAGWYSATLTFHSVFPYAEGIYLQLDCGGLWSNMPCLPGGNGTPP